MNKPQQTTKALLGVERSIGINEFLPAHRPSLEQIRDDVRLKAALKRAVSRETAPQRLINSIRDEIRG